MNEALHYLLWAYFLLYPLYIYFDHQNEINNVKQDSSYRIKSYQYTMLGLWLPTVTLLLLISSSDLNLADIGVAFSWQMQNLITLAVVLLICVYLAFSLVKVKHYDQQQMTTLRQQFAHVQWFMPSNKQQRNWMVFGVSTSAGICEEILYRGYLLHQLNVFTNEYLAVVVSSIAFGLGHIYQGWQHVIRTAILGVVMAGVYLISDSLITAIILHIVIDAYGGQLAYQVNQQTEQQLGI